MNTVVVVAALSALVAAAVAQDTCSDSLDTSQWVTNGRFARLRNDCYTMYHCSNGQPGNPLGTCDSTKGLYYSISLGVCVFNESVVVKAAFGVSTCQGETDRYGNGQLKARREQACTTFRTRYDNSPTQKRLYAGDPSDCRQYFSCQVGSGQDWLHLCPEGTFFNDQDGDCSLLSPDPTRCAR